MSTPDDQIKDALSEDDREFLNALEGERGLFAQMGESMGGAMGGWAKLVFALSVVFGGLLLFCIYKVATTHSPVEHTLWAISALAVLVMQGFIKEWLFNRMNMLTILREVKRLQVQVAVLTEKRD